MSVVWNTAFAENILTWEQSPALDQITVFIPLSGQFALVFLCLQIGCPNCFSFGSALSWVGIPAGCVNWIFQKMSTIFFQMENYISEHDWTSIQLLFNIKDKIDIEYMIIHYFYIITLNCRLIFFECRHQVGLGLRILDLQCISISGLGQNTDQWNIFFQARVRFLVVCYIGSGQVCATYI